MGIEFTLIFISLLSNEQVKTALYLERPASQIQIMQKAIIEQRESDTMKIIEELKVLKK